MADLLRAFLLRSLRRTGGQLAVLRCGLTVAAMAFGALPGAAQPPAKESGPPTQRTFYVPKDAVIVKDKQGPTGPGAPAKDAPIEREGTWWIQAGGSLTRMGGSGTYFVEDGGTVVLDGGHHLVFLRKGGTARFQFSSLHLFAEKGARISTGEKPTAMRTYDKMTFAPQKPFTLRGTVTDAQGKPAVGVRVNAFDLARRHLGTIVSGADGGFLFRPLREVGYLTADVGPRWQTERPRGSDRDLELRAHLRALKGWELAAAQAGWATDATVTLAHPGPAPLTVNELHKFKGSNVGSGLVAFSPDGRLLLGEGDYGKVAVWDLTTGKELAQLSAGNHHLAGAVFSPDGSKLGLIGDERELLLWRTATGAKLPAPRRHEGGTFCLVWSPDGKTLATGGADGMVRLWDADGKERRAFKAHATGVYTLAFSPDGKTLATGGTIALSDAMLTVHVPDLLRLWDPATGRELQKFSGQPGWLAFSPDNRLFAWGGRKPHLERRGNVYTETSEDAMGLRSTATGEELLQRPRVGDRVTFSADGRVLLSASQVGVVWFWEVATGEEILKLPLPARWAPGLTFAPGGERVAAGQTDGTVRVWDLRWDHLFARPAPTGPKALEVAWNALAGKSAAAYQGIRIFAADGDKGVTFLSERLKPAAAQDLPFEQLIADLASNRFAAREAASRALKKLGRVAEASLRQALEKGLPLEARQRLNAVLAEVLKGKLTAEELRQLRAVQALEQVGSTEARKLLRALAGGWTAARQTVEAREALGRLERRARQP